MSVRSLLTLSLALLAHARPRHAFDPEDVGSKITLPVISAPRGVAPSEDKPFHILPFPYNGKRAILEDDEGAAGAVTLPVPRPASRSIEDEVEKRKLPVEGPIGTITLPVIHAHRPVLDRRAVEVQVENRSDVSYYAQLNIGTPPQTVYAQIDTGSFELWVNPDCSNVASSDQRFCEAIGFYNPRSSSSSSTTDESAMLRYGIGSANVSYVKDTIALPGAPAMKQVQFGVASASVDEFSGILGIGAGDGINTDYPNFIDELAAQGITKTKAFSLALGSKAEEEGVIVFGGVDTAKFTGKLAALPIVPANESPDGVARYWVKMDSIALSPPQGKLTTFSQTDLTVFLDSGSTLTLLPEQVVEEIATGLGSNGMDSSGYYVIDCDLASERGTVDFAFAGVTIAVPYSEVIRQVSASTCYLGMMGSTEFALLGDTFLRSAYAVFDLTGNTIHLAQYANCGTKVQTITSSAALQGLSSSCDGGSESPAAAASSSSSSAAPSKTAASKPNHPSSSVVPVQSPTVVASKPAVQTPPASTTAASTPKGTPSSVADAAGKSSAGRVNIQVGWSIVFAAGLLLI
ncbi:aspartic peptidase domain-containing protein [Trichoderma austrokoningii]